MLDIIAALAGLITGFGLMIGGALVGFFNLDARVTQSSDTCNFNLDERAIGLYSTEDILIPYFNFKS